MNRFFVTGGAMRPDAESYIPRSADEELYRAVLAGEYCSVLTTRQMGKSSLMARTAARLRAAGVSCATVDLQGKGDPDTPKEQWYYGVAKQVADGLKLRPAWAEWWKGQDLLAPSQRFTDWFADFVLPEIRGPMVVFVDEVDWMIRLPFSDEFFAAIRACFSRRANHRLFDGLTFVLLGSAAPAQLIKDATRTPFNIGRAIELTDFTLEEAQVFAAALGGDGDRLLARVLYWTDGHPYLTQMLCARLAERDRNGAAADDRVDSVVRGALLTTTAREGENNLKFVGDRLTQATRDLRRVLRVYRQILRGSAVKDVAVSPVHTSLRLSGVVKPDAGRILRVRNRVYGAVFDERWVREKMPSNTVWIASGAGAAVAACIFALWYLLVFPRPYVQALETASNDVQVAYNAYGALHRPLFQAKADELLAQFFERRENRDEAILVRARAGGGGHLASLIGDDYPLLVATYERKAIVSIAFSPDGTLVGTAQDGRLINIAANQAVVGIPSSSQDLFIRFSPNRKLAAAVEQGSIPVLFDVATGKRLFELKPPKLNLDSPNDLCCVAFSPDSSLVAVAWGAGPVRLADAGAGENPHGGLPSQLPAGSGVASLAFSRDGKLLAAGSYDGMARVFDLANGREIARLGVGPREVGAVAFDGAGQLLAAASSDHTVRVLEIATGHLRSVFAVQNEISAIDLSRDGNYVATGSGETASLFEVNTGRANIPLTHTAPLDVVAFSPDGRQLATLQDFAVIRLFERSRAAGRPNAHAEPIDVVAFSRDGRLRATDSVRTGLLVYNMATGREVSHPSAREGAAACADFSPNGELLAVGFWNAEARVYDVATGEEKASMKSPGPVRAVAFSGDGARLAIAGNNTARVYTTADWKEVSHIDRGATIFALAFAPGDELAATASEEGIEGFDAVTGRAFVREHAFPLDPRPAAPKPDQNVSFRTYSVTDGVAFSADDTLLVTQTRHWLHLYQSTGNDWRPIANRFVPSLWPRTVRFLPPGAHCPRCVEVVRDTPDDPIHLERINFDEEPVPVRGDPAQLVKEWSRRLGLMFDQRGQIVPIGQLQ